MFHFELQIHGLAELQAAIATSAAAMLDVASDAIDAGAMAGVAAVASARSFTERTGALCQNAVGMATGISARSATGLMWWRETYASFVDEGTKGHEIWPKHEGVGPTRKSQTRRGKKDVGTHRSRLRIPEGDGFVFPLFVRHPGTQPYRFTDTAREVCLEVMQAHISSGIVGVCHAFSSTP